MSVIVGALGMIKGQINTFKIYLAILVYIKYKKLRIVLWLIPLEECNQCDEKNHPKEVAKIYVEYHPKPYLEYHTKAYVEYHPKSYVEYHPKHM